MSQDTHHPLLPTLVFSALFVLSATLMIYVAWPFRVPLFLAAVMASVSFSLFQRATRRLGGRLRITAALFTLAFLVLLIGPLGWIAIFAAHESIAGLAFVRDTMGVHSLADLNTEHLPPALASVVEKIGHIVPVSQAQLQQSVTQLELAVPQVLGTSSRIVFDVLMMLFAYYFFLVDAPRLLRWVWQISPLENRQTQELFSDFQKVLKATFIGLLVTAAIQGVLITIAYAIARVPFPLFFGLMTAFGFLVPVIGTALVWAPVSALLALSGHLGAALVLFFFCLVVALVTENLVKPLIMRGQIEMHIGLIFISVLGGIGAFGLIGILTGPLVATFFLAMLRLYQRDYAAPAALL